MTNDLEAKADELAEQMQTKLRTPEIPLGTDYEQSKFVGYYDLMQKAQSYNAKLKDNIHDVSSRSKLLKILGIKPALHVGANDNLIATTAKMASDSSVEAMGRYVEKYSNKFLYDVLDESALYNLILNAPIYNTDGQDKEHDQLASLANGVRQLRGLRADDKMPKEKKLDQIKKFLKGGLEQNDRMTATGKSLYSLWLDQYDVFATTEFDKEVKGREQVLQLKLAKDTENLDKDKMARLIKRSLIVAYEQMEEETDEGDKNDIWEQDIRDPYYMTMAKLAYGPEKQAFEEDIESSVDSRERAEDREKRGLNF